MSCEPLVENVYREIVRLAHETEDYHTLEWLVAVGDCFDGGDFDVSDFGNLRWRLDVLVQKHVNVQLLIGLCQDVLDSPRTQRRNEARHCGNLRHNVPPDVLQTH